MYLCSTVNWIRTLTCSFVLICRGMWELRKYYYGFPYLPFNDSGDCENIKDLLSYFAYYEQPDLPNKGHTYNCINRIIHYIFMTYGYSNVILSSHTPRHTSKGKKVKVLNLIRLICGKPFDICFDFTQETGHERSGSKNGSYL